MASPSFTMNHLFLALVLALGSVSCISVKGLLQDGVIFDWRTKGVISPVSDQGELGDAISIVIAEGVESLHAIQNGIPVVNLSKVEVADCCDDEFHQPKYNGYDCIPAIGGLCRQADYKPSGGTCQNGTCTAVGKVTATGYIDKNREDIMAEVIHQTPLTAYMDASQDSFQTYVSGIYADPNCSSIDVDHVVQIVGYGSTDGKDYWIIKNSWGASWGEKGYMQIARGQNMCGIASYVYYPINHE